MIMNSNKSNAFLPILLGGLMAEQEYTGAFEFSNRYSGLLDSGHSPYLHDSGDRPYKKSELSNKQKKARNKSKRAKKARKRNR